jgi:hypothetical protein
MVQKELLTVENGLTNENGTERCPEMSVNNYHCSLRDIPEKRRSQTIKPNSVHSSLS